MSADYLMYCASALYFSCYLPELYATYRNKNANVYNIPEKVLIFIGTNLALSYAIINNNIPLMTNYGPLFVMDLLTFIMRLYYAYQNRYVKIRNNTTTGENAIEMKEFLSNTSQNIEDILDIFVIDIQSETTNVM